MSTFAILLALVTFVLNPSQTFALPAATNLQQLLLPSYFHSEHSGWESSDSCHKDEWNILYHLGGNGPWVEKVDGVATGGIEVPEGCSVDMVHMMSRHAERYPTRSAGNRMLDLIARVKDSGKALTGSLEFLNDWDYFSNSPDVHFEQLTTTGPYAGVLEAFTTGVKLGTRYKHLWNSSAPEVTTLWASECDRVIDTARHFSAGFFGLESKSAKVEIVSEDEDRAGDTLTPGDTCKAYVDDIETGHDYGEAMLFKYRSTYLPAIAARLEKESPGLNFTDSEVYSMQEMCGFETTVRGYSPWCTVFTHNEWSAFEYARDIIHYYRAGPGNKYARAMGWLWLNATTNLLLEGPKTAGSLYFSFVHDGDVVPMLAALGLFEDAVDLPVDGTIPQDRAWKTSQITPMGGRITFERLTCKPHHTPAETYIRLNVNDGIVPLKGCSSGPGESCQLGEFFKYVKRRGKEAGVFAEVCGLGEDAAKGLSFLRQPAFPVKR